MSAPDDEPIKRIEVTLYGEDAFRAMIVAMAEESERSPAIRLMFAPVQSTADRGEFRVLMALHDVKGVVTIADARQFAELCDETVAANPAGKRAGLAALFATGLRQASDLAEELQAEHAPRH